MTWIDRTESEAAKDAEIFSSLLRLPFECELLFETASTPIGAIA